MSPAERRFWTRAQSRARDMSGDVAKAYLQGLAVLRDRLTMAQVERLVASGDVEAVVRLIGSNEEFARAFIGYTRELRNGTQRATVSYGRTIPRPPPFRTVEIGFDILNPNVIKAVREMEGEALSTIRESVRDTVRAHVENGLRDGVSPRTTARDLRDIIGLAPNQAQEVRNYREALEAGRSGKALSYELRDRRYDELLRRGQTMTPEQIERAVERYQVRRIALNAEINARAIALEAQKVGQRLSWRQAIDTGMFEGRRVVRRWVHLAGQKNPRPEHAALNGVEVDFEEPYPNGDTFPGENDPYGCHCIEIVRVVLRTAA